MKGISIDDDTQKKLKSIAKKECRSMCGQIKYWIKEYKKRSKL